MHSMKGLGRRQQINSRYHITTGDLASDNSSSNSRNSKGVKIQILPSQADADTTVEQKA